MGIAVSRALAEPHMASADATEAPEVRACGRRPALGCWRRGGGPRGEMQRGVVAVRGATQPAGWWGSKQQRAKAATCSPPMRLPQQPLGPAAPPSPPQAGRPQRQPLLRAFFFTGLGAGTCGERERERRGARR